MLNLKLMGVINITPNSFSDGSELLGPSHFQEKVSSFHADTILDLGAESTAPMNSPITSDEELKRYGPYLDQIFSLDKITSIDTYHPETISFFQKEWMRRGKKNPLIWNDISGKIDDDVEKFLSAGNHFEYVFCHNLAPSRSESSSHMNFLFSGDLEDFMNHLTHYLSKGRREQIILDPCLGFSKNFDQNWFILENFHALQEALKHSKWLIGFSRKSFLRKKYSLDSARENRDLLDDIHVKEVARLSPSWQGEVWLRTHRPSLISL